MSSLKYPEKKLLETILGMSGGYVLNFTNREFSSFFSDYNINIDHPKYHEPYGSSKANRMGSFWEQESVATVGNILDGLLALTDKKNINMRNQKKV